MPRIETGIDRTTGLTREQQLFAQLRAARDKRLAATDFCVLPDSPLDPQLADAVLVYRKALRDITALDGAPFDGGGVDTPWPLNPLAEGI